MLQDSYVCSRILLVSIITFAHEYSGDFKITMREVKHRVKDEQQHFVTLRLRRKAEWLYTWKKIPLVNTVLTASKTCAANPQG